MSSVLYDIPGPRARARNTLFGALAALGIVTLGGFVGYRFWVTGQFDSRKWEWLLYKNLQLQLFAALRATLGAFLVGAVLAALAAV
jgi:glutamate transport system permease protein